MTRSLELGGSMTALATPFKDGAIDQAAFVRLCQRQIARGTTALVVCGSTGEAVFGGRENHCKPYDLAIEE